VSKFLFAQKKSKTGLILSLMISVAWVACFFLIFVAMSAAASTLSHHHEKENPDRQVPKGCLSMSRS
jgi:hypothetical protein